MIAEDEARRVECWIEAAFGPVATLSPFEDFDEAWARVNEGTYGLQAGVFSRDLAQAMRGRGRLEVGGVIVGDVPSWGSTTCPTAA